MSENNRDKVTGINDRLDWISYQIFSPLADYVVSETGYSNYINTSIDKPTRYYVSRIFFDSIFSLLILVLLLNLLYTIITAGSNIIGTFSAALQLSSVFVLFLEFIRYGINIILFALEESTGFIFADLEVSVIINYVTETVQEYPVLQPVIGAFLALQVTVSESLAQLLPDISLTGSFELIPDISQILSDLTGIEITSALIRYFITVILSPVLVISYTIYKLYYPIYISNERKRAVDKKLPQAVLFLYSLTKGGLDIGRAMEQLAQSEETYGEMSNIFKDITRRAKFSSGDLRESLIRETQNTNHEDLEDFLYGLVSAMDTGSDSVRYLELQTEEFLEQKREEQESYFSFLDILSEMFVILFVVAPIFILIIQLVSAMAGGGFSRSLTQLIPYLFVPAGGFVISALLYVIGSARSGTTNIPLPNNIIEVRHKKQTGSPLKEEKSTYSDLVNDVLNNILEHPYYSLIFTFPVVLFYYSIMIQLGVIPLTVEAITNNMLQVTIYGYYIPLVTVLGPWTYAYESYRRKKDRINKQLPILLENVKEANRRGLTLEESFDAASSSDSTELYDSLRKSINKSNITSNLNRALVEFANEIRVPRLSEAISLLTKANKVSADVSQAVETIADDFNELYKIQRTRKQKAREYVVIVFVSLLISTLLIIALDIVFFRFIATQVGNVGGSASQVDILGNIPEDFFQRIFLHTLMSISAISGFVAGIIENNNMQNGFKYLLIFTTITIFAYTLQSVVPIPGLG